MNMPSLKEAKVRDNRESIIRRDDYIVPSSIRNYGLGKKYMVLTYGCQMNVHDSENIRAILEDVMYTETSDMDRADIIVINTCAIRENAHNKVFGMLGRIKHLKETRDVIVVFCGCMAQEEDVSKEIRDRYKWVDIVFGTHNIHKLPIYLDNIVRDRKQNMFVYSEQGDIYENIPVKRDSKVKAWVNIMQGCDKFCTYCIVPFTRGKQRSRLREDIIDEVKGLALGGYMEVTLLGQNVNAYGKDLDRGYNFANLLEDVALTGIPRIRFVTSHPWDFTDEMIGVISKYDNIMPYIHLPIQCGNDRILKLMGRRYTIEEYRTLFNKIRKAMPDCAISTDIIVGFPGETREEFLDTVNIVKEFKYDLAYTFIFSKRKGTAAERLPDPISLTEKKKWLSELNREVNRASLENNRKYLGKVVRVLLENVSNKEGRLMGYTDTMKLVNVKAPLSLLGKIVDVRIVDVKTWSLEGELVNDGD